MELGRIKGFFGDFGDIMGVIAGAPIIGHILTTLFTKGGEHLEKKLGELLGINTAAAAKSALDEALHNLGIRSLTEPEIDELNAFEVKLRENSPEDAASWVLFMAQCIQAFAEERKETSGQKNGPKTEKTWKDYTAGVAWATGFFKDLLRQKVANDVDGTYQKRYDFLKGKNAFSLKSPPEKPNLIVEGAKKIFTKVVEARESNLTDLQERLERSRIRLERSRAARAARR